jgi:hypothetical protein
LSTFPIPSPLRRWLYLAIGFFLITSWFSTGYNQSDEHFQILEFAGIKLGITQAHDLAWEYGAQMRPTLQPAMVVATHKLLAPLGIDNPFTIAWLLRVLSTLFTLGVSWLLYRVYVSRFTEGHQQWAFFLFSFFLWLGIYNGVRFNSETWSANTFAIAVGLFTYWKHPNWRQYLALGLLVGLSFVFRYQAAFMIAGFGLWLIFIQKEKTGRLLAFILGGLLMAGVGLLIDRWFYGGWVLSTWHYFEQNILLDKASTFGVDPWWKYFQEMIIKGVPPFGLVYLLAIFLFIWQKPKDLITWLAIPFLAIHLLIAHKELRFLYVLLPFLPIVLSTALQWWENRRQQPLWSGRGYQIGWRIFWFHNAVLTLFIMFWPIIMEMNLYRTIYDQYQKPITIYGVQDHPYRPFELYINYYKRKNLYIAEVDNLDELPLHGKDTYLLGVDRREGYPIDSLPGHKKLIYSAFPDWIMPLNFNNWMSRSQWWMVYEIRP